MFTKPTIRFELQFLTHGLVQTLFFKNMGLLKNLLENFQKENVWIYLMIVALQYQEHEHYYINLTKYNTSL